MSLASRLRHALSPQKLRRELEDERQFHLESRVGELRAGGENETSARRQARQAYGGENRWHDLSQETKSAQWLADLLADLRQALRGIRRQPGVAVAAIASLALGLGATIAVFSAVDGVLLRAAPFPQAQQLQNVWLLLPPRVQLGAQYNQWLRSDFWELRDAVTGAGHSFQAMGAYVPATCDLTGHGAPQLLNAVQATAGVWAALRIEPQLGRVYTAAEDQPGRGQSVLLSDHTWRSVFHADPKIVGRTVNLNGAPYQVLGVMPRGFQFPDAASMPSEFGFTAQADIWVPAAMSHGPPIPYENNTLAVVGRLQEGVSASQASRELALFSARKEAAAPVAGKGFYQTRLETLTASTHDGLRFPLLLLLGGVAVVLAVACINVAGLLLARALARKDEFALRMALGAGRGRLARQLLTEAMLLAVIAVTCGVVVAWSGLRGLGSFLATALPRIGPALVQPPMDARVLVVAAVAAIACATLCALAPVLALRRWAGSIGAAGKGVLDSVGSVRARGCLVSGQVAMALVLVVCAGLLARSLARVLAAGGGFNPTAAATAELTLPPVRYASIAQQAAFYEAVRRNLAQIPAIASVGVALVAPLQGDSQGNPIIVSGRPAARAREPLVNYTMVSAGYFAAAGIPLLQGRGFRDSDDASSLPVTVVNEALAARVFPGASAVGQHIRVPIDKVAKLIIGVVDNPRHNRLSEAPEPEMYVSITQNPWASLPAMALVVRVRAGGDRRLPPALRTDVAAAVHAVDRDVPVSGWTPLTSLVDRATAPARFALLLAACFAGFTMLLAAVGIYGVLSYAVTQRRRELGVRMALGADRRALFATVMRHGGRLAVLGLAAGVPLALLATQLLRSSLHGIASDDPMTLAAAAVLLSAVTLLAGWLPARRASRLDPVRALRQE